MGDKNIQVDICVFLKQLGELHSNNFQWDRWYFRLRSNDYIPLYKTYHHGHEFDRYSFGINSGELAAMLRRNYPTINMSSLQDILRWNA